MYVTRMFGTVAETSHSLRHLNKNVLEKAPCSVGVLVDRVNRRHYLSSLRITTSLYRKWKDRGDLGAIGELLASSDIRIVASILVVQQQTRVWGLRDPEESMHLQRDSTNPRQDA